MDIYVQTCGLHPKQDYCWMKILQQENQLKDNPPLLLKVKDKSGQQGLITDFYDSEAASIILAKGESKSILVITALKAGNRSQIYGRPVRNSVAFISEDERNLQKIADRASHNWDAITAEIDRAVDFDDEYGFKVDRQLIEEYIKNIIKQDLSDNLSNIQVIYLNIEEEIKKKKVLGNMVMILIKLIAILGIAILIVLIWAKRVETL